MQKILQLTAAVALLFGGVAYVQADNCVCTGDGTNAFCSGSMGWSTDTPCFGNLYVSGRNSPRELGVGYLNFDRLKFSGAEAKGWSPITNSYVCTVESNKPDGSTVWETNNVCSSGDPARISRIDYNMHND
jgi:hypothetical protein